MSDSWQPVDCSTPGLPVHHQLPEFTQTHVHWVGDAIQTPHSLSPFPPALNISEHQGLFKCPIRSVSRCTMCWCISEISPGGINYAPCRRGDMWSRSVHYTCMEKGICRKCCAKKMANIAIGPSKRNFIFLLLCRHFKRRCNSIVAQSHHPANTLRQDDSFFWTAIRRMLASFFCLRQENYHDTRS